jgi:sterol desaturase/sphingolipid hydroxylase (fatty acid hydroxylase superfamily)
MSPSTGGFLAYFVGTFVFYWWHRWRHRIDFLWLGFQIHHSPQRIEVITSFYKHPVEMIANSIIGSLLVYTLLGLDLRGGAVFTFCCAVGEFFYHTNVKTPRWVGYFFQRQKCIAFTMSTRSIKATTVTSPGGTCYLSEPKGVP